MRQVVLAAASIADIQVSKISIRWGRVRETVTIESAGRSVKTTVGALTTRTVADAVNLLRRMK